jgi:hypothetical protein
MKKTTARGLTLSLNHYPGFSYAPPQALRYRPLCGLGIRLTVEVFLLLLTCCWLFLSSRERGALPR